MLGQNVIFHCKNISTKHEKENFVKWNVLKLKIKLALCSNSDSRVIQLANFRVGNKIKQPFHQLTQLQITCEVGVNNQVIFIRLEKCM